MYVEKDGSVLISSIMFLFIISVLGICFFKNMESNVSIQKFQNVDIDIYDLNYDEEETIKNFMNLINSNEESRKKLFEEEILNFEESNLEYFREEDVLFLNYKKEGRFRRRKINYKFKDEKIILIPSYTYSNAI